MGNIQEGHMVNKKRNTVRENLNRQGLGIKNSNKKLGRMGSSSDEDVPGGLGSVSGAGSSTGKRLDQDSDRTFGIGSSKD